jgi:hypothetical protein
MYARNERYGCILLLHRDVYVSLSRGSNHIAEDRNADAVMG